MEHAVHGGPGAGDYDVAVMFANAADAGRDGAKSGGVDEGDGGEVEDQPSGRGESGQLLSQLGHRVLVDLAGGAEDDTAVAVFDIDGQQCGTPSRHGLGAQGLQRCALPGERSPGVDSTGASGRSS